MTAESLLGRLDQVRQSGGHRQSWMARCPAHDDKAPSLSIRQLDDGFWLVHCFGGCETADVLSAIGLTFKDLFPPKIEGHRYRPERFPARDLLSLAAREALVVAMAAETQAREVLAECDRARLIQAATRLRKLADAAR